MRENVHPISFLIKFFKKTIDSLSETHKKSEFPIKNRNIYISLPYILNVFAI